MDRPEILDFMTDDVQDFAGYARELDLYATYLETELKFLEDRKIRDFPTSYIYQKQKYATTIVDLNNGKLLQIQKHTGVE